MLKETHWDNRFIELAKLISTWSKDPSTQVGAVIVDGKRIVSVGYNGFPMGTDDTESLYNDRVEKYKRVVHAELNCILLAKTIVANYTMYVYPLPPCESCMKAIIQAGIKKVVTLEQKGETFERWKDSISTSVVMAVQANVKLLFLKEGGFS